MTTSPDHPSALAPALTADRGAEPFPGAHKVDDLVDAFFARHRGTPIIDRTMYAASELANWSLLWHIAAGVRGLARGSERDVNEAFLIAAILGAESLLVNQGIKRLFRRGRPVLNDDHVRPHALRTPTTSSFPSGHATAGFCAATVLTRGPVSGVAWFSLATVVASSRVHVQVHHGSDIAAGAVIGVGLGLLGRECLRRALG